MKRVVILLLLGLVAFCYSCSPELKYPVKESEFCVKFHSRSTSSNQNLEEGSLALFNATGGLQIDNQVFTYQKGEWCNEQAIFWDDVQSETYLTVLYPVYKDCVYTEETLYTVDGLEDVLIAKDTLTYNQKGELLFNHLFSMFTVHIDEGLQEEIKEVSLKTPVKISSISVQDGSFVLQQEDFMVTRIQNETGNYSFIIPPAEDCSLHLLIVLDDDSVCEITLPAYSFESGYGYECDLFGADSSPGIRTVEDLKAFCLLVNNEEYSGEKKLSDFGVKKQEGMVYRLLSDLVLTPADCEALLPIGYKTTNPFAAIFDGKGHTISNLEVQTQGGVSGFFGRIDKTGAVKDLHLDVCTISEGVAEAKASTGFLAGVCSGLIDGCSVSNGEAVINVSYPTGGLVGTLDEGMIANCYVLSLNLTSQGYLGGMVGSNGGGSIINSFAASNTLYRRGSPCGGIVGYSDGGSLVNSYLYNLVLKTKKDSGILIGKSRSSTIQSVFYDSQLVRIYDSTNDVALNEYPYYQSSFTTHPDNIPVFQLLQDWVKNESNNLDPTNVFKSWESHASLPAVFQ